MKKLFALPAIALAAALIGCEPVETPAPVVPATTVTEPAMDAPVVDPDMDAPVVDPDMDAPVVDPDMDAPVVDPVVPAETPAP